MKEELINISNAIEEWRWIDEPVMVYFWLRILLKANREERKWHDETIGRGSFITSISMLSAELGLTTKQVRTCIDRLIKGKRIGKQRAGVRANEKTIVTIYDFDSYIGCYNNKGQTKGKRNGEQTANEKESTLCPPDGFPSDSLSFTPYNPPKENKQEEDADASSKKSDKPTSAPSDQFDFVLKLWNDSARRNVPKVRALSPARKEKVKLRVKEMGGWNDAKGILAACFQKINASDFCNGASGKWTATWDWFFDNEKNWMKVLEGNYDNKQAKTELEKLAELYQQGHEHYGQQYGYGGASPYGNPAGSREDGPDEQ